ncbi:hypothetical protein KW800_01185 [Candidatus Parcubacteria bacterium]|nr:hypothetical protein [Candidatus Parcubacteria bacterium]
MAEKQTQSNNLAPLLIILAVLIVAVGWNWIRDTLWSRLAWNYGPVPSNFVLEASASPGQAVSGFPKELIGLATDVRIKSSAKYRVTETSSQAEVLTLTYETGARIPELFAAYTDFLSERGYTILSTGSKGGVASVNAAMGKTLITVSMYVSSLGKSDVRVDVRKPVVQ